MSTHPTSVIEQRGTAAHLDSDPLSPVDAAWFRMETGGNRADIVAVMILDGQLDDESLRATIEARLLPHRRFRRRVVETPHGILPPRWQDEAPFSLDAHISRHRLASPAGDDELLSLVEELVNRPMDFGIAPWRLGIIDGYSGGSVLVAQIHHCMGDGFALIDLLVSLTDGAPGEPVARTSTAVPADAPERSSLSEALAGARRLGSGVEALGHLLLLPFDPVTRLRGVLSGERKLAWSKGVPLSRVKALASARGATLNDVLLAALAGALRRYLQHHGDLTPGVRAIVPVNLRPPGEPIDEERGNWFGLVFVDLPIDLDDMDARVRAIKRGMDRIKASEEPVVSLAVLNTLGRSPAVVEHIANELFARKSSIVVSNVPGPRKPVSLAGRRIRDIVFWVPHPSGLACGASILSYAGSVRVGIRSDRAVLPDPELIARAFDEELLAWTSSGDPR